MDVSEILGLAKWMDKYVKPAMQPYEQLAAALEQNASNTSKVPLRELLDTAKLRLQSMPVEQLTYQQTDLLTSLEVEGLLGAKGWRFVERAVKEGNFDSVSAATDVRTAKQRIDNVRSLFNQVVQALAEIQFVSEPEHSSSDKVTIRIRFKEGVEIANVSQLKKWAAEWYDISRGLTMAVGEKPEDVEVKGAATGSFILILGTTLSIATVIALIMKQVASTVKSSMEVAHTLQDWKMRRVADAVLEKALVERRKSIEANGVQDALTLVREKLKDRLESAEENGLKKSIEKIFSFAAQGGEVDMLAPPMPATDDSQSLTVTEAISTITESVEEMRKLKASTRLLIEDKTSDGPEEDDADGDNGEA